MRRHLLKASTIPPAQILLGSANEANPNGLANGSDQVGRNLMDHMYALSTAGISPNGPDTYFKGRRPTGIYIPRYRNVPEESDGYDRGYGYQDGAMRTGGKPRAGEAGLGAEMKEKAHHLGPWMLFISGFGEMLPNPENRVTLRPTRKDKWGLPIPHIECAMGPNEAKMAKQILADGKVSQFDAVIWNNISGDVLSLSQRTALQSYFNNGGGFVAVHGSAGDPVYFWDWYPGTLIGARFSGHPRDPQFQEARVVVNSAHPLATALPADRPYARNL